MTKNSEIDLHAELNAPHIPGAIYLAKTGVTQGHAGLVQLRCVGEIEELGAELPTYALGHAELAEEGEVEIGEPRTVEYVPAKSAVSVRCRRGKLSQLQP